MKRFHAVEVGEEWIADLAGLLIKRSLCLRLSCEMRERIKVALVDVKLFAGTTRRSVVER